MTIKTYSYTYTDEQFPHGLIEIYDGDQHFEYHEIGEIEGIHYIWTDAEFIPEQEESSNFKEADVPEQFVNELKVDLVNQVKTKAEEYQSWNCKDMYLTSSLGFQINADQCSQNNLTVLAGLLPDDGTTSFKIYDNSFKTLTKDNLKTLLLECQQNGLSLYQQKFAHLAKIAACDSYADLKNLDLSYTMADYSKAAE